MNAVSLLLEQKVCPPSSLPPSLVASALWGGLVLWRGSALGFSLRREGECCPRDFGSRFGKSNLGKNVLTMSHVKGGFGFTCIK